MKRRIPAFLSQLFGGSEFGCRANARSWDGARPDCCEPSSPNDDDRRAREREVEPAPHPGVLADASLERAHDYRCMTSVAPLTQPSPRDVLAYRVNAGIHVTLLWAPDTNTVSVSVWDTATEDRFELVLEPELNPIDVFEHPYAYAAWRGIEFDDCGQRRAA